MKKSKVLISSPAMSKIPAIVIFLALFLFSSSMYGQFRNTKWGMTKQQVINSETKKCPSVFDDFVCCKWEPISGLLFVMNYNFSNNKLYKANYSTNGADHELISAQTFRNSFYEIAELLGEKYNRKVDVSYTKSGGTAIYSFKLATKTVIIEGICKLQPENHYPRNIAEIFYSNPNFNDKAATKSKL